MGFFGRNTDIEQTPQLDSVLSPEVREALAGGQLPVIRTDSLELAGPEQCRYVERAIYEKKVRVARGSMRRRGKSLLRSRTREAPAGTDFVTDISFEQIRGYIYITDRRVIFRAPEDGWERNLQELLSVKPYLNCVKLQFGKDAYKVFVPDGNLAYTVLAALTARRSGLK